jgi:branched-chain amino acid transport system ATP-binding protein
MNDPEENRAASAPILEVTGASKAFGGVRALREVSFRLASGTITGLIGPNGAGKTTLFNLITGVFPADSGRIAFCGEPVHQARIHELVERGIARTFQNVELFGSMSVLENILVGEHTQTRCGMWGSILRPPWVRREEAEAREQAVAFLEFVGLEGVAHQRCSDLPFGWQRLLELARALAARPKLLLLDEPAAGLNIVETGQLGELIRKIRASGVTVLLVEHDMSLTMEVSEQVLVLDQGEKIAEGPPREIQADEAVIRAYLGSAPRDAGRQKEGHASDS